MAGEETLGAFATNSAAIEAGVEAAEHSFCDDIVELRLGASRLSLRPANGGSLLRFSWNDVDVFRPYCSGQRAIDSACFPLVPFCNRIADRLLEANGEVHLLPAACAEIEARHALHGVGWTSAWSVRDITPSSAILALFHDGDEWPWAFEAEQSLVLYQDGYSHSLSVKNLGQSPMPAGLGLHPYFPRVGANLEIGADGFWENGADRLPTDHQSIENEPDWFGGKSIDHCYISYSNPISIEWPTHRLRIHRSSNLPFTHVFIPDEADFFCVEPVSHIPNAMNGTLGTAATGVSKLEPGESMQIECRFALEAIN